MTPSDSEADANYQLPKLDYEQSASTYRQLVDVRFKLLAIVPPLSAIGVGLLTESDIAIPVQLAIGLSGLVVSFGVVIYDQRNSQLHDGAIGRLQHLEFLLGLPKFESDIHPGDGRIRPSAVLVSVLSDSMPLAGIPASGKRRPRTRGVKWGLKRWLTSES